MRFLAVAFAAALVAAPVAAKAQDLLVFAAASLKTALDEINPQFKQSGVKVSYAASSALARQIKAGAPADLFISADLDWMDYLEQKTLVKPGTRTTLLGNRIVLIAPADSKATITIAPGFDLAGLLGRDGRLAIAEVTSVPAGKYGKIMLEDFGVWPQVSGRLVQAENVRAALTLVSRGEAALGIVYESDAVADSRNVRVVDIFPAEGLARRLVTMPVAITAASQSPYAHAYLDHLRSRESSAIFQRHGFIPLTKHER